MQGKVGIDFGQHASENIDFAQHGRDHIQYFLRRGREDIDFPHHAMYIVQ